MPEIDEVNIKKTLAVYDSITSLGQKDGDKYRYNGLIACSDYDGYNITIKNDYVELIIFFHNKFSLNYSSKKERLLFFQKLDEIYKNRKNKQANQ